jgi:hypothetical protein
MFSHLTLGAQHDWKKLKDVVVRVGLIGGHLWMNLPKVYQFQ